MITWIPTLIGPMLNYAIRGAKEAMSDIQAPYVRIIFD